MECDICGEDTQKRINMDNEIHDFQMYCTHCHSRWLFPGFIIEWDLSRLEELLENGET